MLSHAGRGKSKRREDANEAEVQDADIDQGWLSDAAADISDHEDSCNEDIASDASESDDPDLAQGGQVLSAKLAAEVCSFCLYQTRT